MRARLIGAVLACLLTGCVCKRLVKEGAGGARGRLVDDMTGKPIAGASVVRQGSAKAVALTDSDGTFTIEPSIGPRCWPLFPPVFAGPYYVITSFEFSAAGYETQAITNWSKTFDFEPTNFPDIKLRHAER